MTQVLPSLSLRTLAVLPLLLAGTVEAGNRQPGGIIIIINNGPQPVVSHLDPPPPPPAPAPLQVRKAPGAAQTRSTPAPTPARVRKAGS